MCSKAIQMHVLRSSSSYALTVSMQQSILISPESGVDAIEEEEGEDDDA